MRIKRVGGWILFVLILSGWLVLSYRPDWMPVRIEVSLALAPLFRAFLTFVALLFVVIHLYLFMAVQRYRTDEPGGESGAPIRVRRGAEYFWSILPLAGAILLFWAGFQMIPDA